jgi:hypothetical protein
MTEQGNHEGCSYDGADGRWAGNHEGCPYDGANGRWAGNHKGCPYDLVDNEILQLTVARFRMTTT